MILNTDANGNIIDVKCDICGQEFDDLDEIAEFICFDYETGPKALFPNVHVQFDVCQDCFTDKFDEIFTTEEVDDDPNDVVGYEKDDWKN